MSAKALINFPSKQFRKYLSHTQGPNRGVLFRDGRSNMVERREYVSRMAQDSINLGLTAGRMR